MIADPLLESLGKHIFPSDWNTESLVYTSLSTKRFWLDDFLLKTSPPNIYIFCIIKYLSLWLKNSKYISFHGHITSAWHPVRRPKNFIVKQSTTQRSGRISEQSAAAEFQPTAEPDTFTCSMGPAFPEGLPSYSRSISQPSTKNCHVFFSTIKLSWGLLSCLPEIVSANNIKFTTIVHCNCSEKTTAFLPFDLQQFLNSLLSHIPLIRKAN